MKNKKFFTLMELLIVITIMIILTAMLLPALSKAKETGKSISCMSNLKQIGYAMCMYGGDYNGWSPDYPNNISAYNTYVIRANTVWCNWGILHSLQYLSSSKLFICPTLGPKLGGEYNWESDNEMLPTLGKLRGSYWCRTSGTGSDNSKGILIFQYSNVAMSADFFTLLWGTNTAGHIGGSKINILYSGGYVERTKNPKIINPNDASIHLTFAELDK